MTLTVPVYSCVGCVPAADVEYVVEGYEKLQADPDCHSLLKKHLTQEVVDQLKDLCTSSFRSTLRDVIQAIINLINVFNRILVDSTPKKRFSTFPSPGGMSLIKLSLCGNNLVIPAQGEFGM